MEKDPTWVLPYCVNQLVPEGLSYTDNSVLPAHTPSMAVGWTSLQPTAIPSHFFYTHTWSVQLSVHVFSIERKQLPESSVPSRHLWQRPPYILASPATISGLSWLLSNVNGDLYHSLCGHRGKCVGHIEGWPVLQLWMEHQQNYLIIIIFSCPFKSFYI